MAGMMAAAILSDTVMFKSPTCTERDRQTAQRMARLAHISLEELGREIFSVSADRRTAKELLMADYKEFHIAGFPLAVSQITCMDSPRLLQRREEFLELMKQIAQDKGFSMVLLMLTDVLLEGTQLLFIGDEEIICQAFNVLPKKNTVFLPQVMSRKKQVIPMLSALWG
jgi:manganese-dependent inorganic pyrophosphatase